ncbi:MAG: hypothetical protein KZQ99_05920 [Candidatus Thiodiazotropha sp. (ex Dulcina madagascariensis)]|nr:hypothetical protein [Candidatus Thiodiazotropha sp. (ex Dulcina madagascariensis)]
MKWYKYMEFEHARALATEGRFRISSLAYYRNLEEHGNAIGDTGENTLGSIYVQDGFGFQNAPKHMAELEDLSGVDFIDNVFVTNYKIPPIFALCFTRRIDEAIRARLNKENEEVAQEQGKSPVIYDACVEFEHHRKIVRVLRKSILNYGLQYLDQGPCDYKRSRRYHHNGDASVPGRIPAFTKPEKYSWQEESRIVFKPHTNLSSSEYIDVHVPELVDYCRLIKF